MIRLTNPSKAHRVQMRIFGALCAIGGLWLVVIYLANGSAFGHGKVDLYIVGYGVPLLVLGLALLAAKIWAEIILDMGLIALAAGTIVVLAIKKRQDSDWASSLAFLAFLVIPVILSGYRLKQGAQAIRGTQSSY